MTNITAEDKNVDSKMKGIVSSMIHNEHRCVTISSINYIAESKLSRSDGSLLLDNIIDDEVEGEYETTKCVISNQVVVLQQQHKLGIFPISTKEEQMSSIFKDENQESISCTGIV